jgi:hypothetical protein
MKCYPETSPIAITEITECCDWETDVPWASMKEVIGTSPMAFTECCELKTDVPWASMNEVIPRAQSYGHY